MEALLWLLIRGWVNQAKTVTLHTARAVARPHPPGARWCTAIPGGGAEPTERWLSCGGSQPTPHLRRTRTMAEQVEPLHGLRLTGNQVIITVTSTGCTDKADFKITLQESQPPIATFIRVQPDFCRVVPHSVDLAFSLREV